MNEILSNYIAQKKSANQSDRDTLLIKEGLYTKQYLAEDDHETSGNIKSEVDPETKKIRHFIEIPLQLTDEEYQEFEHAFKLHQKNPVARILRILSAIEVIMAFLSANGSTWYIPFSLGIVSAITTFAFSEVLQLLQDIKNKLK